MNFVIRPMRLDRTEVEAVAAMRHAAFFAGTSRTVADDAEGLEALVGDTSGEAFVAESEGAVAGSCLLVERELDQRHEVGPWLAGLVVAPAMRGMGIGAALVKAVEAEADGRGPHAPLSLHRRDGRLLCDAALVGGGPLPGRGRKSRRADGAGPDVTSPGYVRRGGWRVAAGSLVQASAIDAG